MLLGVVTYDAPTRPFSRVSVSDAVFDTDTSLIRVERVSPN